MTVINGRKTCYYCLESPVEKMIYHGVMVCEEHGPKTATKDISPDTPKSLETFAAPGLFGGFWGSH